MTEGEVDARDENVAVLSVDRDPRIRQWLEDKIGNQNVLWLAHVSGNEVRLGVTAKVDQVASERGLHAEALKTILDRNGRAIFVVFRYRRNS
jgi:phage gp36-like protein